jgi:dTMP kinase
MCANRDFRASFHRQGMTGRVIYNSACFGVARRDGDYFLRRWNTADKETTRTGKKKQMLTPTTFSLIHATDLADRIERHIIPPLKAGAIVLADRYVYTAFARDCARGVSPHWVRDLYRFTVKPTVAFYFRVPLEVSLKRILGARAGLKYVEAGLDLDLSNDIEELQDFSRHYW